MKNIKYLLIGLFICSNVTTAQLKAVTYKDGAQVLNGFELLLQKRVRKTWNINFTCLRGIDKASKDIATDLSKLGYFSLQIFTAKGIIQRQR
jgi:hypothetical protein